MTHILIESSTKHCSTLQKAKLYSKFPTEEESHDFPSCCCSTLQRTSTLGDERKRIPNVKAPCQAIAALIPIWNTDSSSWESCMWKWLSYGQQLVFFPHMLVICIQNPLKVDSFLDCALNAISTLVSIVKFPFNPKPSIVQPFLHCGNKQNFICYEKKNV